MAKIPEAEARKQNDIFVCRKCKSKVRATNMKVSLGKAKCRKCDSKSLRPMRKK